MLLGLNKRSIHRTLSTSVTLLTTCHTIGKWWQFRRSRTSTLITNRRRSEGPFLQRRKACTKPWLSRPKDPARCVRAIPRQEKGKQAKRKAEGSHPEHCHIRIRRIRHSRTSRHRQDGDGKEYHRRDAEAGSQSLDDGLAERCCHQHPRIGRQIKRAWICSRRIRVRPLHRSIPLGHRCREAQRARARRENEGTLVVARASRSPPMKPPPWLISTIS
jgi:hypothetical protein